MALGFGMQSGIAGAAGRAGVDYAGAFREDRRDREDNSLLARLKRFNLVREVGELSPSQTASAAAAAGTMFGGPIVGLMGGALGYLAKKYGDPAGSVEAPLGSVSDGARDRDRRSVVEPVAPVVASSVPAPAIIPPRSPALTESLKRKRIGRQETILTSRSALSEASTLKPTLLGQ